MWLFCWTKKKLQMFSFCLRAGTMGRTREGNTLGNGGPFTCKTLDYSLLLKKLNQRQIAWTLGTPTLLFNGEVNNECVCVRVCKWVSIRCINCIISFALFSCQIHIFLYVSVYICCKSSYISTWSRTEIPYKRGEFIERHDVSLSLKIWRFQIEPNGFVGECLKHK